LIKQLHDLTLNQSDYFFFFTALAFGKSVIEPSKNPVNVICTKKPATFANGWLFILI
jgi:hypothetical protein